jgi:hypothetical protein
MHDPSPSSVHILMSGIKSGAQLDPIPFYFSSDGAARAMHFICVLY